MKLIGYLLLLLSCFTIVLNAAAFCSVDSNVTLVSDLNGPQLSSIGRLRFADRNPWPRDPTNIRDGGVLRVVRYCFVNDEAQKKLHCSLMVAFGKWANSLGQGLRGRAEHSLAWKEASNGKKKDEGRKFLRCYLEDYQDDQNPGTWSKSRTNSICNRY